MASRKLITPALAALLIAGVVVVWRAPPTQFLSSDEKPLASLGDADSFMRGVNTIMFAADGQVGAQLVATDSAFYRLQQGAELNNITVHSHSSDGRPVTLTGNRGIYSGQRSELELTGAVRITTASSGGQTELRGEQFRYQLTTNRLLSEQPFTLLAANSELRGEQLEADLDRQAYTINGSVRGRHQPQ